MSGTEERSDILKSELSEKNKYYIGKYRYYELKYYCLQYPEWKKAYDSIDAVINSTSLIKPRKEKDNSSLVEKCAIAKVHYEEKMKIIEQTAIEADEELYSYILKGVTEGLSFDVMNALQTIPCSRDTYYDRYRRFFFLLSKFKD